MKRVIIFSYGPVPIKGQDKVEGGGLRCWGLANGLRENDATLEITLAFHESYGPVQESVTDNNIEVKTWSLEKISELLHSYDSVIVSYCMGDLSVEVAKSVAPNQQLILDCYVPIYVEISARDSDDIDTEYEAFGHEIGRWSRVLERGDIYLCANKNQKRYYQGVLSALGRINPVTYSDDSILEVPYGIYREPPKVSKKPISSAIKKQFGSETDFRKLLWFGGIYPWFDLKELIDAVELVNNEIPTKLILVGIKNPFNAHPDFVAAHKKLVDYIESKESLKDLIIIQEWVDFKDRADWYLDSDLVILINKDGEENQLAWRTRLVDYIWADLPILTNAGDPLGDELVANDAAIKLNSLDTNGIEESLKQSLGNKKLLKDVQSNVRKVRERLYWDVVTKKLAKSVQNHVKPSDVKKFGYQDVISHHKDKNIITKFSSTARLLPKYYRKHGLRSTLHVARSVALRKGAKFGVGDKSKSVVFVSHQLDMTGGPLVLLDMVEDFKNANPQVPVSFHTYNPADRINIRRLNKIGIKPILHLGRDYGFDFNRGDVVVLNTVAYSKQFFDKLFFQLRHGIVEKLVWYIHEDEPELIFSKQDKHIIKTLLRDNKIIIFTPAIKSTQNYQQYFSDAQNIRLQYYRLSLPITHDRVLDESDFDKLRFILPGMVGDGRKGQLPVFYAFANFIKDYYSKRPEKYRDFTLDFVGMGDDFYSRQIVKHADKSLSEHFTYHPRVDHEESLRLINKANITICYSLRECLPIFVFEGMAVGHPILRNDCSGVDEQLREGENGYSIDSKDFHKITESIERILNKSTTTNHQLSDMSRVSNKMARVFLTKNFDGIFDAIKDSFYVKK